jgi:hypothetical protein
MDDRFVATSAAGLEVIKKAPKDTDEQSINIDNK